MSNKILIIEKDNTMADFMKDYLETNDFLVDIELNGLTGLKRALAEDYQMVLLESSLTGKDGTEICRRIKERKNIPVMFVSGKTEEQNIIRGLGAGADDYLCKPFGPGEMIARVKTHIACYEKLLEVTRHKNDLLVIGNLKIDKSARRIWYNKKEIFFTTKEFDLFCYLAEHPNRVCTREVLFREIWDMDCVGEIATVTVHIKKIRKKLQESACAEEFIETIWGAGYRFQREEK